MASTSSATNPLKKHDVFLSFRGTDTRDNFVCFLHGELVRNGIETYVDNRLQGGEEIEPALLRKIGESQISVVILSEHYAYSTYCLRELSKILDCKKEGQIVIPGFYKIDPDDVGNLCGIFGDALGMHEKKCSSQEVYKWRQALEEIAKLKGWDSNVTRPDTELIQKIVDDIQKKLEQMPSSGSPPSNIERFVGITSRVKAIESLLSFESTSVLIVGIWGMGGIGKTTTAKAVYDGNRRRFDGSCFFTTPRKETQKHELLEIFREALKEDLNIKKKTRKLMLQSRKVLIVLDDVNSPQVLTDLVSEAGKLGEGSRIIVTSRDRQVLINECEEDKTYEVKNLDEDDALKLFCLRAFRQENPAEDYIDLSKRALSYVKGIPLVLEVLGGNLRGRGSYYWESKLGELRKNRGKNIKCLEMCYDELSPTEKKIFLDIACFFGRCNRNLVEETLDLEERYEIDRLIDMCLIKIVDDNEIWMHDVVRQLGREIVLKEHIDPGKRSRLWEADDVCRILQDAKGTANVEAILFYDFSAERRDLSSTAFKGMDNLRLLRWNEWSVKFPDGLEFLSNKLRSLCWSSYPLQSLPSNFSGVELVELDMSYSRLERLWRNDNPPLANLKLMNLRGSRNLWSINLSKFPNLEVLNLAACTNLVELSDSIGHCTKLTKLYLSENPNFYTLPSSIGKLSRLVQLDLSHNQNLWSLPNSIGQLKPLAELDLSNCSELVSLPDNIGWLECLAKLNLSSCSKLASLPNGIGQLKCLVQLNLSNCSELASLLDSIGQLKCLVQLNLSDCSELASLPDSIGQLKSLAQLNLSNCSELASLPDSIGQLKSLAQLNLSNCSELASLSDSIGQLKCLTKLYLFGCHKLASLPDSISQLKCLVKLHLSNCHKLASLPNNMKSLENIKQLPKLIKLNLAFCGSLRCLPELPSSLRVLDASKCVSLETVSSLFPQGEKKYEAGYEAFNFARCNKLGENERLKIMNDAQYRIQRLATSLFNQGCSEQSIFRLCIPGLEVPKWFSHINAGGVSLENIEQLPAHLHRSSSTSTDQFLGFAFCAVVELFAFDLTCKCDLITARGHWSQLFFKYEKPGGHLESRHVFIWSIKTNCHFKKASFHFYAREGNYGVVKCGVHLLFTQDDIDAQPQN